MESLNFEMVRGTYPAWSDLGGFAERYAHTDPPSALVKLRLLCENLAKEVYRQAGIAAVAQASFLDLLQHPRATEIFPHIILNKFHLIRTIGNRAAHAETSGIDPSKALQCLREAFDLVKWYAVLRKIGGDCRNLQYQEPRNLEETKGKLQKEKKAALELLEQKERELNELLSRLEEERQKSQAAEKSQEELRALLQAGSGAASELLFDEETTRYRLIDAMLAQAGWHVGARKQNTAEVKQEYELDQQPTTSGMGYADYVLMDENGKPLAVIEAKRTAKSAEDGRIQAMYYANSLQKRFGQRPVIFYTNGFDLYIWNDGVNEADRRLYAFYSKESLQRLVWKNAHKLELDKQQHNAAIVDRGYQVEAIRRVTERFTAGRRRSLIVQATGTGKTRVAIALCDLLTRSRWVKRVLFLCDRRELRKQAYNAFQRHMPHEPRSYLNAANAGEAKQGIFLATYPAMKGVMEQFDPGYFDLIVADESHRSIYNRYRDLFLYFDCLQVGLTATPVDMLARNTYQLFECEDRNPTFHYSYQDAVTHQPPYLCRFRVVQHTTRFLREGIRYADLTPEQKLAAEEQLGEAAAELDIDSKALGKSIFSKDTDRAILRNLMENGLHLPDGTLGKTIIFARGHDHAVQLGKLFNEMYNQFNKPGAPFVAVIDNQEPRAEALIEDFKGDEEGRNPNLTIAISVDMLDTGIDVPEALNLVFAKPVMSYVKFWQMIGRGTRLCENLLGPGCDKEYFLIFDHFGNFEYFGENPEEQESKPSKCLLQQLFEARIALAQSSLKAQDLQGFGLAIDLLAADIADLPENTIAVKEKWKTVKRLQDRQMLYDFSATTLQSLNTEIAPLMQWRPSRGQEDALRFDLDMTRFAESRLLGKADAIAYWDSISLKAAELPVNLAQVADKLPYIQICTQGNLAQTARLIEFPSPLAPVLPETHINMALDHLRRELRGLMKLRRRELPPPQGFPSIDIPDDLEVRDLLRPRLEGLELPLYREKAESALRQLMESSMALQKVRQGEKITSEELSDLARQLLLCDPELTVEKLLERFAGQQKSIEGVLRSIVGMEAVAVDARFRHFIGQNPLNSHQLRFLDLVKSHIARYGALDIETLYEPPFTHIDSEGLDGVFPDTLGDELTRIIKDLNT